MQTRSQAENIFTRYAGRLNRTISASSTFTWDLLSAGVISQDVLRSVTASGRDPAAANAELLKGVMDAIQVYPEKLEDFISVLQGHTSLLAEQMMLDLEIARGEGPRAFPRSSASGLQGGAEEVAHLKILLEEQKQECLLKDQEIENLRRQRDELQIANTHLKQRLEETARELLEARNLLRQDVKWSGAGARPTATDTEKDGHASRQGYAKTDGCLDEDDLETVVSELEDIVDVRGVGLRLGLRMSALQKIRQDERTVEKEKAKILQHWLRGKDMIRGKEEEPPSWSRLADAVEREHRALSMQIRKKYCPENVARK